MGRAGPHQREMQQKAKNGEGSITDFKCALVTGGGGGIGKALSEYFISKGKKVIIAGRTESSLQSTAKEIGAAGYYVLDTGVMSDISVFVKKITSEHPELDCLVNNAAVQRPLEVQKQDAEEFLSKADQEIDINIRGPSGLFHLPNRKWYRIQMQSDSIASRILRYLLYTSEPFIIADVGFTVHLAIGLLPHLTSKSHAVIMNVSSVLGFVPFSIINPVYNGTKAWLHSWSMNLRSQLKDTCVRIVEIVPPTVATDLHRERDDPDDNKKENNPNALSLEEFMKEVSEKLEKGEEIIGAGMGVDVISKWYATFGDMYED